MCNALLFSIYFLINASHNPLNWFHNLSMGCCFGNTGICGEIVLHPERKGWGWGRAGVAPGFFGSVLSRSPLTSLAVNLTARVTTASCSWTLQSSPSSQVSSSPSAPHLFFKRPPWVSAWSMDKLAKLTVADDVSWCCKASPLNSGDPPQLNCSDLWFLALFSTNSPSLVSGLRLVFGSPKLLSNCSSLRTWITYYHHGKNKIFVARQNPKPSSPHSPAVWPWVGHLIALNLSFIIYKIGKISILQACVG